MGNFTLSSYAGVGQANLKNLSVSQTARIGNRLEISGQGTLQMVIARWCQAANRSFTVTGGWDSRTGVVIEELGAQIDKAFENVDLALKDAGGAGWSQVYRVRSYHLPLGKDAMDHMVQNFRYWMPNHQPLWTCVGISQLGEEGMQVEIEVAALDEPKA
ncbi:putative L-PSP endoribonuclease family protein [Fonsecaea pedrosoi]|nr:putative L-PSP endoribonuclease family protein [Fonsecaea pedrosoi]